MGNIKKSFGQKLKFYREQKKFTQESLAEAIGINFRSISLIERGINFVTAETLEKICKTLEISPKQLFDFEILNTKNQDIDKKILNLLKDNKEKLEEVYLFLKTIME